MEHVLLHLNSAQRVYLIVWLQWLSSLSLTDFLRSSWDIDWRGKVSFLTMQNYDYLSVTFMNTSLFQIESTKIRIAKFYEMTARIPQQLDNSRKFYSSNLIVKRVLSSWMR
jgi:K+-transporting ATPase A subunit